MVVRRTLPWRPVLAFHEGVLEYPQLPEPRGRSLAFQEVNSTARRGRFLGGLPCPSTRTFGVSSTAGDLEAFSSPPRVELDVKSGVAFSEAFLGLPWRRLGIFSRDTYAFMSPMWAFRVYSDSVCANVAITGDSSAITTYGPSVVRGRGRPGFSRDEFRGSTFHSAFWHADAMSPGVRVSVRCSGMPRCTSSLLIALYYRRKRSLRGVCPSSCGRDPQTGR
jgi:hypothetical protein